MGFTCLVAWVLRVKRRLREAGIALLLTWSCGRITWNMCQSLTMRINRDGSAV
jgi:hypothetical protein